MTGSPAVGRFDGGDGEEDPDLAAQLGDFAPERHRMFLGRFVELFGVTMSGPHRGGDGGRRPGISGRAHTLEAGRPPFRFARLQGVEKSILG